MQTNATQEAYKQDTMKPLTWHYQKRFDRETMCGQVITNKLAEATFTGVNEGSVCPLCEWALHVYKTEGHYIGLTVQQTRARDEFTLFVNVFAELDLYDYAKEVHDNELIQRVREGNIRISDVETLARYANTSEMGLIMLYAQYREE